MFTRASRLAKTIGLAAGLILIGGSLVGGIALAATNGDDSTPAVTGSSIPTPDTTTGDHQGDDADDDDQMADEPDGRGDHDDCDEGDSSDHDCSGTPTAVPSPSRSHNDDDADHGGDD